MSHTVAKKDVPASAERQPYPTVDPNPDFPKMEEKVLAFWKAHNTFEQSVESRPATRDGKNNEFVFYDGPPFANGLPHYGHLLTGFVKDTFPRYQTLKGKRVERRFGWDCHGLPAEMGAEKELEISGRAQITEFGIDKFNDHCRSSVMRYASEWESYVTRQARWVDFQNDYKTMDKNFMESVMWAFKQLHEKGLLYESYRVMPYSWAAETPLSNFETRLDNSYRERVDKAITVAFELNEKPQGAPEADSYHVMAWTTTPWTLPSNLALAASKEVEYACMVVDEASNCSPLEGERASQASSEAPVSRGGYSTDTLEHARKMRKEPTEAEKTLWQALSGKKLEGHKFRRQQPVGNYIVDFYAPDVRLVVEVDGGQHSEEQKAYDERRTAFLELQGYRVLRVWNNDVLQNLEGVLQIIAQALVDTSPHDSTVASGSASPAPPQGGSTKKCYLFAKAALANFAKEFSIELENAADTINAIPGSALIGQSYTPLFPYFKDTPNAFRILDGSDFIEEGEGTGVVHMAPGFGEDDQRVCEAAGIPLVVPVDHAGKYTEEIYDIEPDRANVSRETLPSLHLKGLNVIAQTEGQCEAEPYTPEQLKKYGLVNLRIINWLKMTGKVIKQDDYAHNYPHCWRTDTPLIYRALPSWYVKISEPAEGVEKSISQRMVELNEQINWIPGHVKHGLFGKWIENARDWSISRNRFWGAPIPVWKSDDPDNDALYVFGSISELNSFFDSNIEDLHRPVIDELTKPDPENPNYTLRRVPDVLDCWFESGSMPYGQVHYPFENKEWFDGGHNPSDFIVEYAAQTRGWFYTMMVLGTALFDRPPFLNCICHGIVLDANGEKLSKRLNNYPDPKLIFDQYGADALRWFMLSSPIMRGQELYIDKEGQFIRDSVRLYVKPLWNAYNFFTLYANADGIKVDASAVTAKPRTGNRMDRYIRAKLKQAVQQVEASLDAYDTPGACEAVTGFLEVLNNWYIRRNRERFWKPEKDDDKRDAYDTLYTVLQVLCRTVSPLLPLVSEEIYRGLSHGDADEARSVHLLDWPHELAEWDDEADVVSAMDRVRDACNAGLSIRNKENLRVRLPLASLTVVAHNAEALADYADLIKDEVNVKEVKLSPDVDAFAKFKLQVNLPVVGKKYGKEIPQIMKAANSGDWEQKADGSFRLGAFELAANECMLLLEAKGEAAAENRVSQPLSSNDALVVLDTEVTESLRDEGIARDLVRMVQQARKDADLNVSDRIMLAIDASESVQQVIKAHERYIAEQVLAQEIALAPVKDTQYSCNQQLEGAAVEIGISVAE